MKTSEEDSELCAAITGKIRDLGWDFELVQHAWNREMFAWKNYEDIDTGARWRRSTVNYVVDVDRFPRAEYRLHEQVYGDICAFENADNEAALLLSSSSQPHSQCLDSDPQITTPTKTTA